MTKQEFYNKISNSKTDLISDFLDILHSKKIHYCVIGGVAINAHCEPLLTLDFDCVVIVEGIEKLKEDLKKRNYRVKTHPHTWEITHKASDLRLQIQRDERYQEFLKKAEVCNLLGYTMRLAGKEDILQGKIWAYEDLERNELKRAKDLLDIRRLVQRYPKLEKLLSEKIKRKIKEE
ncbi:MAG: hypothetical protein AB1797_06215 [bacterium]